MPLLQVCQIAFYVALTLTSVTGFDVRRSRSTGISCFSNQFQCDEILCIPFWKVCNGKFECSDIEDEKPSLCRNRTCSGDQFSCGETGQCIKAEWRCDKDADCSNSADEIGCESVACKDGEFKCENSGACISSKYVCDLQNDCGDLSDERNCQSLTCSRDEFTCTDGRCIQRDWVCDYDNDCMDGSDEENCV